MSSYLLAFIVSKYAGNLNADQTFGVYARPDAFNETKLALDFGQNMLKKLGEFVSIDYYTIADVTKLDMAVSKRIKCGILMRKRFKNIFFIFSIQRRCQTFLQVPWRTGDLQPTEKLEFCSILMIRHQLMNKE